MVDYVVVTSLYDFAYVNLALQATNGVNKTSETPSVKRRMERPIYPSAVGSKTPGQKWQIFSAMQKFEEKFKEKDAQKVQLQTTLKEKAEIEFKRLRQSFCFKARPLPSFNNERASPKSPLKKTPQANQKSLTPARKTPTTFSQPLSVKKSSRRLWKTSDQNPDHPLSKYATLIDSEDTHYPNY
ncbi:WVD2-like protein 7 [Tanacetum coccineum]